jgi:hypothetical protein
MGAFVAKPKTARAKPALQMALIRQLHVYISVFVAPSLLFFAVTGALQTFRIPDQKTAPAVIQKLARLHKDDVFAVKPPRPERAKKVGPEKPPEAKPPAKASIQAMKWFFAAVSVGVIFTTVFGLWMGLAYNRRKLVVWALLAAGVAVPVVIASL